MWSRNENWVQRNYEYFSNTVKAWKKVKRLPTKIWKKRKRHEKQIDVSYTCTYSYTNIIEPPKNFSDHLCASRMLTILLVFDEESKRNSLYGSLSVLCVLEFTIVYFFKTLVGYYLLLKIEIVIKIFDKRIIVNLFELCIRQEGSRDLFEEIGNRYTHNKRLNFTNLLLSINTINLLYSFRYTLKNNEIHYPIFLSTTRTRTTYIATFTFDLLTLPPIVRIHHNSTISPERFNP